MAITLAQLSQRRSSSISMADMHWVRGEAIVERGPEQYYANYTYPPSPPRQSPTFPLQHGQESYIHASHYQPHPEQYHASVASATASTKSFAFYYPPSPESIEPPSPPPRPIKRASIEPDPLPPHSNPQSLTYGQSHAFTASTPVQPVRVGRNEVWNAETGLALYTIAREAAHMPSFLSTKPLLTVRKTSTGAPAGNIRFHVITSNDIELTVNGQQTQLKRSRGLIHKRWGFHSTTSTDKAETWYWKKDKSTGGAMLEDAKKNARVLARMKGDLLKFERGHLSDAAYDEIVMSAVAMAEAARRAGKSDDIVDLAQAVGDFAAAIGGGFREVDEEGRGE